MKLYIRAAILMVLATFSASSMVYSENPDDNMKILNPLIGTSWEGHLEDSKEVRPTLFVSLDSMLGGSAVRLTGGTVEGGTFREGVFYWDPEKKQVCYLALTTRGGISTGVVTAEGSLIVQTGRNIGPDGLASQWRHTWELSASGMLIVRNYSLADGNWKPGHVVIYSRKVIQKSR